jgi:hypothetical protein
MFASLSPDGIGIELERGPGSYLVIRQLGPGKRSHAIAGHRFRGINLNPVGEELS